MRDDIIGDLGSSYVWMLTGFPRQPYHILNIAAHWSGSKFLSRLFMHIQICQIVIYTVYATAPVTDCYVYGWLALFVTSFHVHNYFFALCNLKLITLYILYLALYFLILLYIHLVLEVLMLILIDHRPKRGITFIFTLQVCSDSLVFWCQRASSC